MNYNHQKRYPAPLPASDEPGVRTKAKQRVRALSNELDRAAQLALIVCAAVTICVPPSVFLGCKETKRIFAVNSGAL